MAELLPIDARSIPKTFQRVSDLSPDTTEARVIGPPPDLHEPLPRLKLQRLWLQNMKVEVAARLALHFDPVQLWLNNVQTDELTWTSGLTQVEELLIEWNTKLESLAFLEHIPPLRRLRADGLKRVNRLDELSHQPSLKWLWIGGGIDRRLELETLQPLACLTNLERLYLITIQLREPSLEPLGALKRMQRLHIQTNMAPMEEYARLAAALPDDEGEVLRGFVTLRWTLSHGVDLLDVIDELKGDEQVIMVGKGSRRYKVATDRDKIVRDLMRFRAVRDCARNQAHSQA